LLEIEELGRFEKYYSDNGAV